MSAGLLPCRRDISGHSPRVAATCPAAAAFAASFEPSAIGRAPLSVAFLARLLLADEVAALAAAAAAPLTPTAEVVPPLAFVELLVLVLPPPFAWDVLEAKPEEGWLFPPPPAAPPLPAELSERLRLLDGYRRSELSLQAGHSHCCLCCGVATNGEAKGRAAVGGGGGRRGVRL